MNQNNHGIFLLPGFLGNVFHFSTLLYGYQRTCFSLYSRDFQQLLKDYTGDQFNTAFRR